MSNADVQSRPALQARYRWRTGWRQMFGRFLALLLVFAFFAVMVRGGKFYSPRNLENIARQSAVYATASLGMTMVIIAAGIDLSMGSMIESFPSSASIIAAIATTGLVIEWS